MSRFFGFVMLGMVGMIFGEPPLVYEKENTGDGLVAPALPGLEDLPVVEPLTDPLLWSDGSGRVKEFEEWRRRRAEIKAEIEHYEIGKKPGRPEKLKATYKEGMLKVEVTVKGETLTLSSRVSLPEGEGPFPAVIGIGMGGRPGSLPPEIFSSRKVAVISFNFGEAMAHTQKRWS